VEEKRIGEKISNYREFPARRNASARFLKRENPETEKEQIVPVVLGRVFTWSP
jgi:hypothetical protein